MSLDNISLIAEYEFNRGGAQRLLATLSYLLEKPIYTPFSSKSSLIWGNDTIPKVPSSEYLLSIVVNKYNFVQIPGKVHIKFCHSNSSISQFLKNDTAKKCIWLTHRARVFEYARANGFNITLIPNGYIPYISTDFKIPKKTDQIAFISRLSPEKKVMEIISSISSYPLVIAGSNEKTKYVDELKSIKGRNTFFIDPNDGYDISEEKKQALLAESKILVHGSVSNCYDYLEYSILDGMNLGCIPLCLTDDIKQYFPILDFDLGIVISDPSKLEYSVNKILNNYDYYLNNVFQFMRKYKESQDKVISRWKNTLEYIIKSE